MAKQKIKSKKLEKIREQIKKAVESYKKEVSENKSEGDKK